MSTMFGVNRAHEAFQWGRSVSSIGDCQQIVSTLKLKGRRGEVEECNVNIFYIGMFLKKEGGGRSVLSGVSLLLDDEYNHH